MSHLDGYDIISNKYFKYIDENYDKFNGDARFYEASKSLQADENDNEKFLIVDNWNFIRELNEWLNDNYSKELYEETGYELPKDISDKRYFTEWLDYLTHEMWGFADEYSVCDCCNKAFKTSPDSYSWVADYWVGDGFIFCGDCVRENEDYSREYLESLENNPHAANTILLDDQIKEAGYKRIIPECEYGWYGKQDDPEAILDGVMRNNKDGRYLFSITRCGQFFINFDMWEKESKIC